MALAGGLFPIDQTNALTGPARALWAPTTVAVPTKIGDIVNLVATTGEYAAKTGWKDFGLAVDAPSYSRDMDSEGIEYEQVTGALFESITEVTRELTVSIADFQADHLKMIENAATTTAIAATPNNSAQTRVDFGHINQRETYRMALIAEKPREAAEVVEPGGGKRGALIALVLHRVKIAADEAEIEIAKGEGTAVECTFSAFPESTQAAGKEYGSWLIETAGTITAV